MKSGRYSLTKLSQRAVKMSVQQLTVLVTSLNPNRTIICVSKSRISSSVSSSFAPRFSQLIREPRMNESLPLSYLWSSEGSLGSFCSFCFCFRRSCAPEELRFTVFSGLQRYWKQNLLVISASSILRPRVSAPNATIFKLVTGNWLRYWSMQNTAKKKLSRFIDSAPQSLPNNCTHRVLQRSCVSLSRCLRMVPLEAYISFTISAFTSSMKSSLAMKLVPLREDWSSVSVFALELISKILLISLDWVCFFFFLEQLLRFSQQLWASFFSPLRQRAFWSSDLFDSSCFDFDLLSFRREPSSLLVKFSEKLFLEVEASLKEQFFTLVSFFALTNLPSALMRPRWLGNLNFWKALDAQSQSSFSATFFYWRVSNCVMCSPSRLLLKFPQSVLQYWSQNSFFLLVFTLYLAQKVLTPQSLSRRVRLALEGEVSCLILCSSGGGWWREGGDLRSLRFLLEDCLDYFLFLEGLAVGLAPRTYLGRWALELLFYISFPLDQLQKRQNYNKSDAFSSNHNRHISKL